MCIQCEYNKIFWRVFVQDIQCFISPDTSKFSAFQLYSYIYIRGYIQNFPDWVDNEINNNNKHSLRSNTKGYGGKIHYTNSQNSDTTALSGRELYHLQFSLQAASPETFGYTLVYSFPRKSFQISG
jgi:hypothetical protein